MMMPTSADPRSWGGVEFFLAMAAVCFLGLVERENPRRAQQEAPKYSGPSLPSETQMLVIIKHLVAVLALTIRWAPIAVRFDMLGTR